MKLIDKNLLFLGAAGVSYNGNGYIFPGKSGVGKTVFSVELVKRGLSFLGDDWLIVDPDKKLLFGCPRPIKLLNPKTTPDIGIKLKTILLIKSIIKKIMGFIINEKLRLATEVPIEKIIPNVKLSKPVSYKRMLLLEKDCHNSIINLNNEEIKNELISKMINNLKRRNNLCLYVLFDKPELIDMIKEKELTLMEEFVSGLTKAEYINNWLMDGAAIDQLVLDLKNN